ncbi:hypothetical protein SAMN04487955_101292 [Halomonas korlensis]|uniref:Uncharacterized protein n=1 Tax=Halomonas korlensis TaxID=463301 RepID=A0A1I7F7S0_9GAMM|nr:hypothetical protein SAMN04487955_101292 [Halomonas korlensis]
MIVFSVVAYYAVVLLVWLEFSANSYAWLPYQGKRMKNRAMTGFVALYP